MYEKECDELQHYFHAIEGVVSKIVATKQATAQDASLLLSRGWQEKLAVAEEKLRLATQAYESNLKYTDKVVKDHAAHIATQAQQIKHLEEWIEQILNTADGMKKDLEAKIRELEIQVSNLFRDRTALEGTINRMQGIFPPCK